MIVTFVVVVIIVIISYHRFRFPWYFLNQWYTPPTGLQVSECFCFLTECHAMKAYWGVEI
jgi:hypothetical protein